MAIKSANGNKKYKWQLCKNGKQSANSNQELLTKGMCTGWWKSAGWWHLHFISDELCNTFGFMITSGVFALCVCDYSMYIELFLFAQNCFAHSFCWKFPIAICTFYCHFCTIAIIAHIVYLLHRFNWWYLVLWSVQLAVLHTFCTWIYLHYYGFILVLF